ncbi:MAG TPA: acetate/propionate family kinase [Candidatus Eisenbacteria bacterium]|nr:acetate/propionate family kinase [Candidatus Eisenbacteria bacterium]
MRVLVANAGSSSLKLRVLEPDDRVAAAIDLPAPRGRVDPSRIGRELEGLGTVDVVGHRIVHGGTEFTHAVRANDDVVRRLHALADLAPLHQPAALAVLTAVCKAMPGPPAILCFDTAFHATMPAEATTIALPAEWRLKWNLKRYGFHGLSHAYASRRAAGMIGTAAGLRVVTCHLGSGASLAAVVDGRSRDTTMGFTPLDGLVMATRSGSIDPGLVLWLQGHAGTPPEELASTLDHRSGLLGLAGTADMREIVARTEAGDPIAGLALDVYVHRLRAGIAAMSAAMDGLDALVFTGGVGENSAAVRQRSADGLRFLGVALDPARNVEGSGDREIGRGDAPVRTLVVAAREDLEIARQVREVMAG